MVAPYDAPAIELRWRLQWEADELYRAEETSVRPKWYELEMFPYTSGDLHIGHWYAFTPADAHARLKRMQGYNVMQPIGFDAFGLPAENAARRSGTAPAVWTMQNIHRMRDQFRRTGVSFDFSREIATCLPSYYRWTQWLFVQFYKNGLAYRALAPVNWCPSCQTVLANEQIVDGTCERCGTEVTRKNLNQWFFRITKYAEELLHFDGLEWPDRIKLMQTNWIGRSAGVVLNFHTDSGKQVPIFTTRPETVFGVSFLALAPEHPRVAEFTVPDRRSEVSAYQEQTRKKSEVERLAVGAELSGVFLGSYAINPLNRERVPIWIADFVLETYGTGAVMGVPAHDQRDFRFARQHGLPIQVVIVPPGGPAEALSGAYLESGRLINSDRFNGLSSEDAREQIAGFVVQQGLGERKIQYRLRDWLVSRQRCWGAPIPIVYCDLCGTQPVPEDQLPVRLPADVGFLSTGESPLRRSAAFLHTSCPRCGGAATRETDTLDTFVDSSWYYLRYCSPHDSNLPWNPEQVAYWAPVDQYTGGAEHATMHLFYARFVVKALRDLGWLSFGEPFTRLYNQGLIVLAGAKMSKSRGNVVNPDELVSRLGGDTVRAYLMFVGPWDLGGEWNDRGIQGIHRFLVRVWTLVLGTKDRHGVAGREPSRERAVERLTHQTIGRVTVGLEQFRFNTQLAALMEFVNTLGRFADSAVVGTPIWQEAIRTLLLLLAPTAPFVTEELWSRLGLPYSIHQQSWPAYRPELAAGEEVTVIVQVDGKIRDRLSVPVGTSSAEVERLARESTRVRRFIANRPIANVVYVPGQLVNLVTH